MSNIKSGYEIRADLIYAAQQVLESNANRVMEATIENNNHAEEKQDVPLTQISASDIVSVAKELNEFVTQQVS